MAHKLKVLTPQTTDGTTLAYDSKNQVIYKESIVEVAAKRDFESLNAKLPKHLRHKLEVVEEKAPKKAGQENSQIEKLKKELEAAKAEAEAAKKQMQEAAKAEAEAAKK